MKENIYSIYGLNVCSEIAFDEVKEGSSNNIDVHIKRDIIPKSVKEEVKNGISEGIEEFTFWRNIPGIGIYYIYRGELIGVEIYDDSKLEEFKTYLLGVCMGVILFQRNKMVINGSAIKINDKAIIISGVCGAGKSTLTTALRLKGYGFITDDLSVLDINETISVFPGYAAQRICEDTMKRFNLDVKNYRRFKTDKDPKYIVEVYKEFCENPAEVGAIFNVEIGDVDEVKVVQVIGMEKVKKLLSNLYALTLLRKYNKNSKSIDDVIKVSKVIPVYRIIRPRDGFTVNEQVNLIEELVNF